MASPGRRLGRLIVTTCPQPGGAPLVDEGRGTADPGGRYRALVIVPPWRLRSRSTGRWRTEDLTTALVLGWCER